MRIAIIDTYYQSALNEIYKNYLNLGKKNFDFQKKEVLNFSFGTSDSYSYYLSQMNFDVIDIIANCGQMQNQWYVEYFKRLPLAAKLRSGFTLLKSPNLVEIALLQINEFNPDVIYCQDLNFFPLEALDFIRSKKILLVGQIACPLPHQKLLNAFDLILSSFPHYVDFFQKNKIKSEFLPIGFDPRVLDKVDKHKLKISASFVGGISKAHSSAINIFEYLADTTPLEFFGYIERGVLSENSPILRKHNGERWGINMYSQLAASNLTINRHIEVSENFANNMRLFEATGVGTLLLTDYKRNLDDYFKVGKEILTYRSKEEAEELINYYLSHPNEAKAISIAGQKKCISEHSYQKRMESLAEILLRYI